MYICFLDVLYQARFAAKFGHTNGHEDTENSFKMRKKLLLNQRVPTMIIN